MNLTNLLQYKSETATPKPKSTINSYRSFGYSLSTALADIIDNSISAGAKHVRINYKWNGSESFVSVLDDGSGMNLEELVQALTPGSIDPVEVRKPHDLGRFGLGLKTASFSQCKQLTVVSKKSNHAVIKRTWDLDFVNETEEWILLDYISDDSQLNDFDKNVSGTKVIWNKLDRIIGHDVSKENEAIKQIFYEEFEEVENHLALVFHRFIEKNKLNIFINDRAIKPWDPFLKGIKGAQIIPEELLLNGDIKVKSYILPHSSFLNAEQLKAAEGPKGWFEHQGFYIYRNERLLVCGDWLGLFSKKEHYKLARILIDIPNHMDDIWKIDIKKSRAYYPPELKKDLERLARKAISTASAVYKYKGNELVMKNRSESIDFQPVWTYRETREKGFNYSINENHPLIRKALNSDNITSSQFKYILKLIGQATPVEVIIENHNENPEAHELRDTSLDLDTPTISVARQLCDIYMAEGVTKELAVKRLLSTEPFNKYPEIIEYLK